VKKKENQNGCMSPIVKHFKLVPEYVRLAMRREAEYKAGFYTFIVNQVIGMGIWLVFWRVILNRIGNFGSWNFPLVVVLSGFVGMNFGIWFTFSRIWRLPSEILTGSLNSHLLKPVHPFLHMLLKGMNLRSIPRICIGLGILIFGLVHYDLSYTPVRLVIAALTSILSFLATFIPFATVCLLAFWIGRAEFLRDLFIELFMFRRYPLSEFPNAFIMVFTFIMPLLFSGTVPVLVLTRFTVTKSLLLLGLLVAIISVQLSFFIFLWRRGLKRYESFGG